MKAIVEKQVEVVLRLSEEEAKALRELARRVYVDFVGRVRLVGGYASVGGVAPGFDVNLSSAIDDALYTAGIP